MFVITLLKLIAQIGFTSKHDMLSRTSDSQYFEYKNMGLRLQLICPFC